MPTISLTQIAIIAGKLAIIGLLFALMVSFMGTFQSMISNLLSNTFSSMGSINSLNLGYIAGAIGLDSFVNALLASLYTGGSLYISGMVGIIIFKHSIKVYQTITNF